MNGRLRDLLHRMRPGFRVQINFLICLGLAVLVAVGILAQRSIDELVETGRFEGAAMSDLGMMEAAVGLLRRAESAQRKYLITGAESDLAYFRDVRRKAGGAASDLHSLGGDVDQIRRLARLVLSINERLDLLDAAVGVRRQHGLQASIALIEGARALQIERRIESLTEEFRHFAVRSLRHRRDDTAFSAETTAFMIFWGTAFAVVLLVWTMLVINRNQAARAAALRALRASEAQLRLITDTVPAFIGYVDRTGRLQFHNRTIELWLERDAARIHGFSLRNLLDTGTYDGIEPYVARVLKGESVQFDFVLPTRDGRPRDISAQLVPGRDESDAVSGFYVLATDVSALKEVDRLKSEFVTTVSHELRTPLTSIRGSLGLLAGGVTGVLPDKAKALVKIAMENCERLVRLVNDILDSEKMLAGKIDMTIRNIDLVVPAERSVKETESFASSHGVRVTFSAEEGVPPVEGDGDRLVQVITNLISNACKFSPAGGEVEVRIRRLDGAVALSISDRGPGVPVELRSRLFERFAQLDSSDSRRRAGTGLGLNICRGIIERLGGRIGYRPREGGGSVFEFSLPAAGSSGDKP